MKFRPVLQELERREVPDGTALDPFPENPNAPGTPGQTPPPANPPPGPAPADPLPPPTSPPPPH